MAKFIHALQFCSGLQEINNRLIRLKEDTVAVSNQPKIQLEKYLIFDDTLPSAILEKFACKEVMGQKSLPP
jgi:hypothetical protein